MALNFLSAFLMAILCLGGSFNPIHHGHLICGRAAAEVAGYQRVALIPSNNPPHKLGDLAPAPAQHRAAMCRLAVAGSDLFTVDERELHRPGPSYTIDTARALLDSGSDRVDWLIGSDSLPFLPTWHRAEELVELVTFKVMFRPGAKVDWHSLPPKFRALESQVILTPRIDISATDIRQRLGEGRSIDYLVPPAVADYIHTHGLYRRGSP
ncbi:MAG TPA: nicotinate (nicotinamide) nucleotide adenylyltransferase [Tepidisphaeraceae bacterium]|nr:nicotinate (nicotinamide) nucleotide adenylyltransferase [Tepidisphaeraceae bacterium]